MRSVHTGLAAVLTLTIGLALPGPAVAEREYDFAKALWQAGYRDLAIQQYRRLLAQEGASTEEKARAHFDLAAVYQEEADQIVGAAGRQSLLRQAEAELALALKEAGTDVVLVFAARQQQALLLQNNARHLAALLDRSGFAGDRAATTAEAVRAFDQSVAAFQALAKDAEGLITRIEKEAKQGYRQVAVRLQNE